MARGGGLPHVAIRTQAGMVTEIALDGQPLKGIKSVSFRADVQGGYPVVTLELWATVELDGLVAVVAHQQRHVQRCSRPHNDEGGPVGRVGQENAPESSSGHSEAPTVASGEPDHPFLLGVRQHPVIMETS